MSSLVAMIVFALQDIQYFDPNGTLQYSAMAETFDADVEMAFVQEFGALQNSAFHIQDKDCSCSSLSNNHIRSLDIKFFESDFKVHTLTPQSNFRLVSILPSLPALVIFDDNGKLAYMGPYSSGYFCGAKSSLIEPIVTTIINDEHFGALVISDSQGCYCAL